MIKGLLRTCDNDVNIQRLFSMNFKGLKRFKALGMMNNG